MNTTELVVEIRPALRPQMKIPADVREAFADVKQIRKSPTKEVLEWLAAHSPEKSIKGRCKSNR